MSGIFLLDWAILAVSLFNTILLFWLGLTVLLNAERRTRGLWLAGGAMLLGGLFFFSHTAIVGTGPLLFTVPIDFWWHLGWVPVLLLPFAWYTVMLWYNGFWDNHATPLHRQHRLPFGLTMLLALGTLLALVFLNPIPSADQLLMYEIDADPSLGGVPVLILVYPFYSLLCTGLSLDVLRRPAPTPVVMGHLARQRARPWLVGASLGLFAVSLLVGAAVGWIVLAVRSRIPYLDLAVSVAWYDLVIASLIALITLLLGQAVVAYEVFTASTLPRRGLLRYWRRAIILAAGFGASVALGLSLSIQPVLLVLIASLLMTVFFALLSSRAYQERQHYIDSLRPFISSQEAFARILSTHSAQGTDVSTAASAPIPAVEADAFQALCRDLLGASVGYLVPLGALASLAGPVTAYQSAAFGKAGSEPGSVTASPDLSLLEELLAPLKTNPQQVSQLFLPIPSSRAFVDHYPGAAWAIPLWNSSGLSGLLLLGDKTDGSLYTREEIEVGRAAGERLLDARASSELAHRLAVLQRQHITQSQLVDRRTRRVLHDDVLPELHAAMLSLSAGSQDEKFQDGLKALAGVHGQVANLLRELPPAASAVRQSGLVPALHFLLEREHTQDFNQVTWQIDPLAEERLASLPPWMAEVLYYAAREAVRNAAHHARGDHPEAELDLVVSLGLRPGQPSTVMLTIEDNGVGISSSFSNGDGAESGNTLPSQERQLQRESQLDGTAVPTGSGQGLALHSTLMALIGGALELSSRPGLTRVTLTIPA